MKATVKATLFGGPLDGIETELIWGSNGDALPPEAVLPFYREGPLCTVERTYHRYVKVDADLEKRTATYKYAGAVKEEDMA